MDTLPYLLPWVLILLATGISVAVKFLPIKSIAGIAVISVLSLIMLLTAIYANVITSQQFSRVDEKQMAVEEIEAWKYRHLDELSLLIAQLKPPSDDEQALLAKLKSFGWLSADPQVQRMKVANDTRERVLAEYQFDKPMLIKGIPKTVDYKIVELSLRQVGFTPIPYRDDEEAEDNANIIYYGRDMNIIEVKLAALTLMRAGLDLKAIKPFPKPTQGNVRAIKIEWNKYYISRKGMTADEIEKAQVFN